MATVRTKLKQLRDADVRFISLVDRAATRIPFRVLKQDKESTMGIDLTRVFKTENSSPVQPHISSLVVFAQKDETAAQKIQEAIEKHGFVTNRVQKSDEGETLVYAQGEEEAKDTQIVRLSDQMLVSVANLPVPKGWVGELVEQHGFFPDLKLATSVLYDQIKETAAKSETPLEDLQTVLEGYAGYLTQMSVLPANCFKLDEEIAEIVEKCSCGEKKEEQPPVKKEEEPAKKADDKKPAKKAETEEERKKRQKSHPPAEMAPPDEEDDQKPPPAEEEEDAKKSDDSGKAVLALLKGIESTVAGLATKVEAVITEQTAQKKTLDEVVQKSDTLSETLKTTVTAPPTSEDRPSGQARMRVQKDDDPRTGTFDTAFLRRRK